LRKEFEPDPKVRKKNFYVGLEGLNRQIDQMTEVAIKAAETAEKEEAACLKASVAVPPTKPDVL
jgi:hypothetical protein